MSAQPEGARIRAASPGDAEAITRIYNHYVAHTPATFDLEPPPVAARRRWLEGFGPRGRRRCLVADAGPQGVVGWVASERYRKKAAYDHCVETSIYLDPVWGGRGLGTRLYAALFEVLAEEDVHRALAAITLPNPASVALHRRVGFREIGVFEEVGRKHGRWWSVLWMQRGL